MSVFIASWMGKIGSKDHLEDKVEHRAFQVFVVCSGNTSGYEEGLTALCADGEELISSCVVLAVC